MVLNYGWIKLFLVFVSNWFSKSMHRSIHISTLCFVCLFVFFLEKVLYGEYLIRHCFDTLFFRMRISLFRISIFKFFFVYKLKYIHDFEILLFENCDHFCKRKFCCYLLIWRTHLRCHTEEKQKLFIYENSFQIDVIFHF